MTKPYSVPSPRSQCKRCDGWVPVGDERQHLLDHHRDNPEVVRQAQDLSTDAYLVCLTWFGGINTNKVKNIYLRFEKSWSEYACLRAGLGLISMEELAKRSKEQKMRSYDTDPRGWCPVKYLVLKRRMSGEYVVVEGRVSNPTPVEPEIRFRVNRYFVLYIRGMRGNGSELHYYLEGYSPGVSSLDREGFTFPELVAGWQGFTMEDLKERLFARIEHELDPQTMENLATEKFYVNEMEAIT